VPISIPVVDGNFEESIDLWILVIDSSARSNVSAIL
jgi:hypothetical protein